MIRITAVKMTMTALSAVALGLIMCLHGPTLPKYWLFDLGVPWFFLASGFWYGQKRVEGLDGYWVQVRKRVGTLLVPYFIWNLIWFPILFVCNWIGWKYCGAERVVDGSSGCVMRCLGLSPSAWPALVPTWFLRALFVAVVVVGGVDCALGGLKRLRGLVTVGLLWIVYLTRSVWMPEESIWDGFFTFGLPLIGFACFATGLVVGRTLPTDGAQDRVPWVQVVRRQMMPVYVLHAAVIVSVGWVAKAMGVFGSLATVKGDVVMWFVGIAGAVAIGEVLRRFTPRIAEVLFGGR